MANAWWVRLLHLLHVYGLCFVWRFCSGGLSIAVYLVVSVFAQYLIVVATPVYGHVQSFSSSCDSAAREARRVYERDPAYALLGIDTFRDFTVIVLFIYTAVIANALHYDVTTLVSLGVTLACLLGAYTGEKDAMRAELAVIDTEGRRVSPEGRVPV